MAKAKKKKTQCDYGDHKLFDTLGGDKVCALGCGYREKGGGTLKKEGMRRAEYAGDVTEWRTEFKTTIRECAKSQRPFTSEHIIAMIGLPRAEVSQHANNAVGAMMGAAARTGVIRKTGKHVPSKRPSSHGAELTEWIGNEV